MMFDGIFALANEMTIPYPPEDDTQQKMCNFNMRALHSEYPKVEMYVVIYILDYDD